MNLRSIQEENSRPSSASILPISWVPSVSVGHPLSYGFHLSFILCFMHPSLWCAAQRSLSQCHSVHMAEERKGKNKTRLPIYLCLFYFTEFRWGVPNLHKWRVRCSLLGVDFQPFLQTLSANHACKVCERDRQLSVFLPYVYHTLGSPSRHWGSSFTWGFLSQTLTMWSLGVPTWLH